MTEARPRKDGENLAKLEGLRPRYERLRTESIRAAGEVERHERDYAAACAAAEEAFGTSDLAEMRRVIEERRAANAVAVDEFEAALVSVESALKEIEGA